MNLSKNLFRVASLGSLFASVLAVGCLETPDAPESSAVPGDQPDAPGVADGEAEIVVDESYPEPIAIVEVEGGYRILFIELVGTDGARGVGMAEEIPEGTPPVLEVLGLAEASPLEVFLAFTDEEEDVPNALMELYGDIPSKQNLARGVAKDDVEPLIAMAGDVACGDGWFTSWVNDSLPSDTWRLNQNGSEPHWGSYCDYSIPALNGCGACSNALRKKYDHVVYNVDEWRAYSCLNSTSSHLWACSAGAGHLYLRVAYLYRDANNNGWHTAYISPAAQYAGQNRTYSWHWNTGSSWDWTHAVRGAITSGHDRVDLYTGWRP